MTRYTLVGTPSTREPSADIAQTIHEPVLLEPRREHRKKAGAVLSGTATVRLPTGCGGILSSGRDGRSSLSANKNDDRAPLNLVTDSQLPSTPTPLSDAGPHKTPLSASRTTSGLTAPSALLTLASGSYRAAAFGDDKDFLSLEPRPKGTARESAGRSPDTGAWNLQDHSDLTGGPLAVVAVSADAVEGYRGMEVGSSPETEELIETDLGGLL